MGGVVVRALASLQCGPGSFSSPEPLGLICNRPRNDGIWEREWAGVQITASKPRVG